MIKFMSYYYYSTLNFKDDLQICSDMFNHIIQCEHNLISWHMLIDSA